MTSGSAFTNSQVDLPKRKVVKDPLWGTIPLLPWEEELIEDPIFSRLHNVLQNSTAYRVYPALRTSRFSHSVGVMHVATQLFRSSLLAPAESSVEGLRALSVEAETLASKLPSDVVAKAAPLLRRDFSLSCFDARPASDKFHILLAVVRLAALLHDIGHLPYSHIFEFAVEEVSKSADAGAADAKELIETLAHSDNGKKRKLHEHFGDALTSLLQQSKLGSSSVLAPLVGAAREVLLTDCISRSFVSGMIDADRIDFVRRDLSSSGLQSSSVDYGRLFSFYELVLDRSDNDGNGRSLAMLAGQGGTRYVAAPGKRALSDAEKLLWERFLDYKYVASHHRVHFGDELLERCISRLITIGRLKKLLQGLKGIHLDLAKPSKGRAHEHLRLYSRMMMLIMECDDNWLEMKIRKLYRDVLRPELELDSGHLDEDGSSAKPAFDEYTTAVVRAYIEDRDSYTSAFGNDDVFWDETRRLHPDFADMIQNIEESEKFALVNDIAATVNQGKYQWEQELFQKHKKLVIIGDLSHKLKIGFSPRELDSMGHLRSLGSLYSFLQSKVSRSPIFNFWFPTTADSSFRATVLSYVVEKLRDQKIFTLA